MEQEQQQQRQQRWRQQLEELACGLCYSQEQGGIPVLTQEQVNSKNALNP